MSSSEFLLGLELRSVQRSRAAGRGRREMLLRWERMFMKLERGVRGWGVAYKSHRLWNCPSAPAVVLSCYIVKLVL